MHDSIIGRQSEIQVLVDALKQDGSLTVVTGLGGIGKTRLATEVARQQTEPVIRLNLDGATEATALLQTAQAVLGTPPIADLGSLWATLEAQGPVRVVLDAFEGLADRGNEILAPARVAAPRLSLLVTSRLPVVVAGQSRLVLGPLAPEDSAHLMRVCAQQQDLSFRPERDPEGTQRLLACLDGLPLAIELAARRLGTLTPRELAVRLDEGLQCLRRATAGSRQASLLEVLQWSVGHLPSAYRQAALTLATVTGQFSAETAESLVEADDVDGLEALAHLLQVGVLHRTEATPGLAMLGLVRRALLAGASETDRERALRRHADHFLERCAPLCAPRALFERVLDGEPPGPEAAHLPQLESIVEQPLLDASRRIRAALGVFATLTHGQPSDRYRPLTALLDDVASDPPPHARLLQAHLGAMALMERPTPKALFESYTTAKAEGDFEGAAQLGYWLARHPNAPAAFDAEAARRLARTSDGLVSMLWSHDARQRNIYLLPRRTALDLVIRSSLEAQRYPSLANRWLVHRAALLIELARFVEARRFLQRLQHKASPDQPREALMLEVMFADLAFATDDVQAAHQHLARATVISETHQFAAGIYDRLVRLKWELALTEGRSVEALGCLPESAMSDPRLGSRLRWMLGVSHLMQADPEAADAVVSNGASPPSLWAVDQALEEGLQGLVAAWRGETSAAQIGFARARARAVCRQSRRVESILVAMVRVAARWLALPPSAFGLGSDRSVPPYLSVRAVWPLAELKPDVSPAILRVGRDLRWCEAPQSARLDLAKRPVLQRIIGKLVDARLEQPGGVVEADSLIAAGWPDDRSGHVALRNRLWVALSRLRRQGWSTVIERVGSGYRIPEELPIQRVR
ncbi:MAG: hypothetical protein AAGA48_04815 [Myxococcota bacterium]